MARFRGSGGSIIWESREIKDWRLNQSQSITQRLRPDLWTKHCNKSKKKIKK